MQAACAIGLLDDLVPVSARAYVLFREGLAGRLTVQADRRRGESLRYQRPPRRGGEGSFGLRLISCPSWESWEPRVEGMV